MNKLTELEIEEVSLVDAGANPAAHIKLFKRKEEKIMAAEKLLQETEPKVEKPSVEKSETKPEEPKVEKPQVEKAVEKDEKTEPKAEESAPVEKSGVVELAAMVQQLKETVAAQIEKAEDNEFRKVAEKYEILGQPVEKLAPVLKKAKREDENAYNTMVKILDDALAAVEKARTFEEIGKSGYGSASGGQIEAIAKEIHKSKPNLSWREALDEAFVQHPELQY